MASLFHHRGSMYLGSRLMCRSDSKITLTLKPNTSLIVQISPHIGVFAGESYCSSVPG